jgi:hypothetical protein
MGWSLSPFCLCKMKRSLMNFLRSLDPKLPCPAQGKRTNTCLRRTRWRGSRILPYVNKFSIIRGCGGRSAYLTPTPRQPPRPYRHASPPNQGLPFTNSSRPPHGNRHRHSVMLLLRSRVKTRQDHATSKTTHRTSYTERTLATRQRPSITSGPSTLPFLGYPKCQILPPRAILRSRREVGRPSSANT